MGGGGMCVVCAPAKFECFEEGENTLINSKTRGESTPESEKCGALFSHSQHFTGQYFCQHFTQYFCHCQYFKSASQSYSTFQS